MEKHIHLFNNEEEYNNAVDGYVLVEYIDVRPPDYGPSVRGYFVREDSTISPKRYYWSNGYYTLERNPYMGGNAYNEGGTACRITATNKTNYPSAYSEPWISYTEGKGVDYNKTPIS